MAPPRASRSASVGSTKRGKASTPGSSRKVAFDDDDYVEDDNDARSSSSQQNDMHAILSTFLSKQSSSAAAASKKFEADAKKMLTDVDLAMTGLHADFKTRMDERYQRLMHALRSSNTLALDDALTNALEVQDTTIHGLQNLRVSNKEAYDYENDPFDQDVLQMLDAQKKDLPRVARRLKKAAKIYAQQHTDQVEACAEASLEYSKHLKKVVRI